MSCMYVRLFVWIYMYLSVALSVTLFLFLLTPWVAALGKALVLALLGDLFRLSCWGGEGWGGGGGGGDKNVFILRPCTKHWYLQLFASLYNVLQKDVEQENLSQASMPFATKTVLSVLNVSAQPQSPKLEPLQARCTLNTPALQKHAKTLAGMALFKIRPHCSYLVRP